MGHRLPQAAPQGARALQHRQPPRGGRPRRPPRRVRRPDRRAARVAVRPAGGTRTRSSSRTRTRSGSPRSGRSGDRRARRRPALADRAAPPGRGRRLARHRLPLQPVRRAPAHQGDVQRRRLGARRAAHRAGRPRRQAGVRALRRPARRLARGARARAAAARARVQRRPGRPEREPPPGRRLHRAVDAQVEAHLGRRAHAGLAARHGRGGLAAARRAHHDARTTPTRSRALDEIHEDYRARYADAVALTFDHTRAESVLAGARGARRPAGDASSSCAATSRRRAGRLAPRRPPSAAARRPRSCAAPSYAASPAAEARSDAGDALAGARLLVEVLVLDEVQDRHAELAARA